LEQLIEENELIPRKELVEKAKNGLISKLLSSFYRAGSKLRNLIASLVLASGIAAFGETLLSGCRGNYSVTFLDGEEDAVCVYNGLRIKKNMLMIPFKGEPSKNEMLTEVSRLLKGYAYEVVQVLDGSNIIVVRFPDENVWNDAKKKLIEEGKRTGSKIRGASVVPLVNVQSAGYLPNDPEYRPPDNWGYPDTKIDWLWNKTFGNWQKIGLADLWFGDLNKIPDLKDNLVELKRINSCYADNANAIIEDLTILNGNPIFAFNSNATGYWKAYTTTGNNDRFRLGDAPDYVWEKHPRIAAGNGNACCAFVDWKNGDEDISACLTNAYGRPLKRFKVNQITDNTQTNPAISFIESNGDGRYVISWVDYSGGTGKVKFRLFSAKGDAVSDEVIVDAAKEEQDFPFIVSMSNGNFAVLYAKKDSADPKQNGYDIWARTFDFNGNALSNAEVIVSGQGDQFKPKAAFIDKGNNKWRLFVAWQDGDSIKALVKNESGIISEFDIGNGDLDDVSVMKDVSNNEPYFGIFYSRDDGSKGNVDWNVHCNVRSLDGSLVNDWIINQERKGTQLGIKAAGAVAVWTDFRDGNADVYAINLSLNNGNLILNNERRIDNINERSIKRWHGMAVASMLGGIDNFIGTAGGEFKIWAYETDGTADDLGRRIEELLEKGCKAILCTTNLPWIGIPNKNDPLVKELLEQYAKVWKNIARLAAEKNALIIVSAGNNPCLSAELSTGIPLWLREAIPVFLVVGGYYKIGNVRFAFGSGVKQRDLDLVAPGSARAVIGIIGKNPIYGRVPGASIGSCFAGIGASLLWAYNDNLTPRQIKKFLTLSGLRTGRIISKIPSFDLEEACKIAEEDPGWSQLEKIVDLSGLNVGQVIAKRLNGKNFYILYGNKAYLLNEDGGVELSLDSSRIFDIASSEDGKTLYLLVRKYTGSLDEWRLITYNYETKAIENNELISLEHLSSLKTSNGKSFHDVGLVSEHLFKHGDKLIIPFQINYDAGKPNRGESIVIAEKKTYEKDWNFYCVPFCEDFSASSINPKFNIGELGDLHIVYVQYINEGTPSQVCKLHYVRRKEGNWYHEIIAEGTGLNTSFSPSSLCIRYEVPQVVLLKQKQTGPNYTDIVNTLIIYKKDGNSWKKILDYQLPPSSCGFWELHTELDKDGRLVAEIYNWKDGLYHIFDDGKHISITRDPSFYHSAGITIQEKGDLENIRQFYPWDSSGIYRLEKKDY